jgi:hypothetical protein
MMELILGVATGFFIKKSVSAPDLIRRSPIDIFRESIRDVVCSHTGEVMVITSTN